MSNKFSNIMTLNNIATAKVFVFLIDPRIYCGIMNEI